MNERQYLWACKQCQKPFESSINYAELTLQESIQGQDKDETFELCSDCALKYWDKVDKEYEEYWKRHCSKCGKEFTPHTDVPEDWHARFDYEKEKGPIRYCNSCRITEVKKRKKKEKVEMFFILLFALYLLFAVGYLLAIHPITALVKNPSRPWYVWTLVIIIVPFGIAYLILASGIVIGGIPHLFRKEKKDES